MILTAIFGEEMLGLRPGPLLLTTSGTLDAVCGSRSEWVRLFSAGISFAARTSPSFKLWEFCGVDFLLVGNAS